jgi:hypothetical protein
LMPQISPSRSCRSSLLLRVHNSITFIKSFLDVLHDYFVAIKALDLSVS